MMGNRECESSVAELLERHFEVAFSAPEGVKKLRELILTLAMKGKLVPQDPNDPPASELLKEIEAEKQRLVKEGKIKTPKALPPVRADEVPYALPSGWAWVRLGDFVYLEMGQSPASQYYNQSGDGLPFFQGKADFGVLYPTPRYWCTQPKKYAFPGDVLLSVRAPVGPTNISNIKCCIGRGLAALRPIMGVRSLFVNYFMMRFRRSLEMLATGTTFTAVTKKDIENLIIPLPPLFEQQRIVARIDELMARCDALETLRAEREEKRIAVHAAAIKQLLDTQDVEASAKAWRFISWNFGELYAVKENVAELRKAILQLAVMGKLVPQDPNDPPASELLKEVEAEKQRLVNEGKIKKKKPLPPINPDEVPYELPTGWEWVRLGEIVKSMDYGTSQKTCDDQALIPVYRMGNIVGGQIIDECFKYISPDIEDLPRLYLKRNDILFNRTNSYELVGKSALYKGSDDYATFASYLIRVGLFENQTNPEYISMVMNAPYFRSSQIEPEIVQQCGQANFNGTKLSICSIPLPPMQEQLKIVAKADRLMTLCDQLQSSINAKAAKQAELLGAVMV